MNPFLQYYQRYCNLAPDFIGAKSNEEFSAVVTNQSSILNNYFMAGLGMGTLFLRMGAVIQMSARLHDGDIANDTLFLKQVMDNLRETLPSDTNWKNLWYASMQAESKWEKALTRDSGKNTVLDRFVSFRNKFVHQYIRLIPEHIQDLLPDFSQVLLDILRTVHTYPFGKVEFPHSNRLHLLHCDLG